MIKLFSVKARPARPYWPSAEWEAWHDALPLRLQEKQKKDAAAASGKLKQSPGELRMQKGAGAPLAHAQPCHPLAAGVSAAPARRYVRAQPGQGHQH